MPHLEFGSGGDIFSCIPKTGSRLNGKTEGQKGKTEYAPSKTSIPQLESIDGHLQFLIQD